MANEPSTEYRQLVRRLLKFGEIPERDRSFLWDLYQQNSKAFSYKQKKYIARIARSVGVDFYSRFDVDTRRTGNALEHEHCSAIKCANGAYQIVDNNGYPYGYPLHRKDALIIAPWFNSVLAKQIERNQKENYEQRTDHS